MNVAEDNCAKIREALEFTISQIQSEKRSKTSTAMHSMIKHWLQEYGKASGKECMPNSVH